MSSIAELESQPSAYPLHEFGERVVTYQATPALRYVEREGVVVLQQLWAAVELHGYPESEWRDVPVHVEVISDSEVI